MELHKNFLEKLSPLVDFDYSSQRHDSLVSFIKIFKKIHLKMKYLIIFKEAYSTPKIGDPPTDTGRIDGPVVSFATKY